MPDTPSITINKRINYRGQKEVYSNTYHFSGTTPSTPTEWNALATAIWNAERTLHPSSVEYVGFLGYNAGNEFAVAIRDFVAEGATLNVGAAAHTAESTPGDVAAWVRWATPDRTSRGKTIYLRKYFHEPQVTDDTIAATYKTAALAYGAKMIDGTLPGGAKVCGPQGAVASTPFVSPFSTTRTLKRRGKRPSR